MYSTSNIFIRVGSVVKDKIIITIIIRKWWVLLARPTGLSGPALRYYATVGAEEPISQSVSGCSGCVGGGDQKTKANQEMGEGWIGRRCRDQQEELL